MNHYKLLEPSYIHGALRPEGFVVEFNDDPKNGGLVPGPNMVQCDENGNEVKVPKAPKAPAKPKADADKGKADADKGKADADKGKADDLA